MKAAAMVAAIALSTSGFGTSGSTITGYLRATVIMQDAGDRSSFRNIAAGRQRGGNVY